MELHYFGNIAHSDDRCIQVKSSSSQFLPFFFNIIKTM